MMHPQLAIQPAAGPRCPSCTAAALGRARRDRGVRAARRPALAAAGDARRELLRAHASRTSSRSATCRACAARSSTARASRSPTTGPRSTSTRRRSSSTPRRRGRARAHARPLRRRDREDRRAPRGRHASAIRRRPILVLEDQGRDRAALVEQAQRAAARRRGPSRAVSLLPAGRSRGAPRRLHDADDRRRGRPARPRRATTPSDLVGRYGLESAWENYLRGKKGVERYAVDARGQRLDDATVADADPGRARDRAGARREPGPHDRRRAAAARREGGRARRRRRRSSSSR